VLKDRVPFAVVGSNTVIEIDGKKIRGRKYPWGVAEGTDFNSNKPACAFNAHS
jgi:septin 7